MALAVSMMAFTASCSRKSLSTDSGKVNTSAATTEDTGPLVPTEDSVVTAQTGQLQLAPMVTILPAKGSSAASLTDGQREIAFALADDHVLHLRVTNDAFQAVDQAGSIMCSIAQTKFWEQANAGVYAAYIDDDKCNNGSNGGGGGGGGGQGGQSQQQKGASLSLAYVKATREDGKPMIADFRVSAGDDKTGGFYHVHLVVAAPPSDSNPAGIFDMNFTQHTEAGDIGDYGFISTERTSDNEFLLRIGMSGEHNEMSGIADLTKDGNDFTGLVVSSMSGGDSHGSMSSDFKARFDAQYLNVSGTQDMKFGSQKQHEDIEGCFDRNTYKTAIFRYDLTDASGTPVALNSGFPAEYEDHGTVYPANASYWGLWVDGGIVPSTGDTIYKVDWNNDGTKTRTPYTIFVAPGKLTKMTKATTTLGDLKGIDLGYWAEGNSYNVRWDGKKLAIKSKVTYGSQGIEETAASGDVTIPQWGLNLWVTTLNANIQIPAGTTLANATELAYCAQTVVSGTSDVPSEDLVCFNNCPVMAPTKAAFTQQPDYSNGPVASALYKTTSNTWGETTYTTNQASNISSALATYTFDATKQVLMEGSTAFTLPSGLPTDPQGQQVNQDSSGALIPKSVWQAMSDKTIDPYSAEQSVDSYYRWDAGPMGWSQFQALKDDSGAFVTFDKPIDIDYVLTSSDEFDGITDTNIVGKSYRLTYGGPGQFWGIPWKYNADVGHEMPLFSLKAGTKVGDYLVYPLDGEQRMAKTAASKCASLSLDDMPSLPTVEKNVIDNTGLGDTDSPTRYIGGVATSK